MIVFHTTGTVVGKVNAVDIDDPKTLHSKIKYSLLSGLDLFQINPETGVITTLVSSLDREVSTRVNSIRITQQRHVTGKAKRMHL